MGVPGFACMSRIRFEIGSPLILPEVLEPAGRQFGIAYRVLNVLVAEIELNRACVVAGIRQVVPGGVAQHVRVNRKSDSRRFRDFGNHAMDRAPRHRAAA